MCVHMHDFSETENREQRTENEEVTKRTFKNLRFLVTKSVVYRK